MFKIKGRLHRTAGDPSDRWMRVYALGAEPLVHPDLPKNLCVEGLDAVCCPDHGPGWRASEFRDLGFGLCRPGEMKPGELSHVVRLAPQRGCGTVTLVAAAPGGALRPVGWIPEIWDVTSDAADLKVVLSVYRILGALGPDVTEALLATLLATGGGLEAHLWPESTGAGMVPASSDWYGTRAGEGFCFSSFSDSRSRRRP